MTLLKWFLCLKLLFWVITLRGCWSWASIQKFLIKFSAAAAEEERTYFVIIGDPELGRMQQVPLRSQWIWSLLILKSPPPPFLFHSQINMDGKRLGCTCKEDLFCEEMKHFPPGCCILFSGSDLPFVSSDYDLFTHETVRRSLKIQSRCPVTVLKKYFQNGRCVANMTLPQMGSFCYYAQVYVHSRPVHSAAL